MSFEDTVFNRLAEKRSSFPDLARRRLKMTPTSNLLSSQRRRYAQNSRSEESIYSFSTRKRRTLGAGRILSGCGYSALPGILQRRKSEGLHQRVGCLCSGLSEEPSQREFASSGIREDAPLRACFIRQPALRRPPSLLGRNPKQKPLQPLNLSHPCSWSHGRRPRNST